MIIAGLTGGIGHGKTTLAAALAAQSGSARHFETWELVAEVGAALRSEQPQHPAPDDMTAINAWLTPLSDILRQCTHANIRQSDILLTRQRLDEHPSHYVKLFEYLEAVQSDTSLIDVDITAENKEQFRPLLQWLGGYLVIKGGSVWYDELLRRIAHLQSSGYDLVTIGGVRYPADAERLRNAGGAIIEIIRPDLPLQDAHDLTERDRNLIKPDSHIKNDGTLEDLRRCAQSVYHDLSLRQLQPHYACLERADLPVEVASN